MLWLTPPCCPGVQIGSSAEFLRQCLRASDPDKNLAVFPQMSPKTDQNDCSIDTDEALLLFARETSFSKADRTEAFTLCTVSDFRVVM
jgi:hypothetical protein